jgi:hypothetical protein
VREHCVEAGVVVRLGEGSDELGVDARPERRPHLGRLGRRRDGDELQLGHNIL